MDAAAAAGFAADRLGCSHDCLCPRDCSADFRGCLRRPRIAAAMAQLVAAVDPDSVDGRAMAAAKRNLLLVVGSMVDFRHAMMMSYHAEVGQPQRVAVVPIGPHSRLAAEANSGAASVAEAKPSVGN